MLKDYIAREQIKKKGAQQMKIESMQEEIKSIKTILGKLREQF